MKIKLNTTSTTPSATYVHHLADLLRKHASQHEYIVDDEQIDNIDIYHSLISNISHYSLLWGDARSVLTVPDLNFLRYPQLFSLFDRLVRIRRYKYACRAADCVITLNRKAKDELAEKLHIDEQKIRVLLSLAAQPPLEREDQVSHEMIRRKYMISDDYVLMMGVLESRHNQLAAIEAMVELQNDITLVICGRHTSHADFLLDCVRTARATSRVSFIYEPEPTDLPALFRMARGFVYLPDADAEASVLPVIEALRAEVPMILSDIPIHREAAADAAMYVAPQEVDCLVSALESLLGDAKLRCDLITRERVRAELFSEWTVAQRLIDIYSSL
ncbi:MAG: glycosyltransferase [Alistipes sp.]